MSQKEFDTHPYGQMFGGWGPRGDGLPRFAAFYPNVLAKQGLVENIALQMAFRARWAAQLWARNGQSQAPARKRSIARLWRTH